MSGEFPNLMWQREYNKKWILYLYDEMRIINNAVQKKRKTVSLPSNDPKKKIMINLEKMIQKNTVSGYEQRIRCLIFNGSHISWSWQGDYEEFISYQPHVAFLLEVAYHKKMEKVDITLKDDYEIDLQQLKQVNKETQYERSVSREIVVLKYPKESSDSHINMMKDDVACKALVQKAGDEFSRFQNYLFGMPTLVRESTSNGEIELPTVPEEIMTALNAGVQHSPSAQLDINVAVDPDCPEASNYVVYSENGDNYNATLNFANLQNNNNKFFIIQLLKHVSKNKFAVWFHWGRVGYKGQCNLVNCGNNLEEAKTTFETKFYDKTRNHWSERHDFQRVPSKYDLVHVEFAPEVTRPVTTAETKLDIQVQNLLKIICNKKNLEEAAKEMDYDSVKIPLGKLKLAQIQEGYQLLNEMTELVKAGGTKRQFLEVNDRFYTKIPHDFGRKAPPLICSYQQIKEKLEMLKDLSLLCEAIAVVNSFPDGSVNIIDQYYGSLNCDIFPVHPASEKFEALRKCLSETHGPTHSTYTMELTDAFTCVKEDQESSFLDLGNKKLLWHGSRVSNWIGILRKGLQIAPPEAPSTGYMFGKGIYFADISSKSANYCFATKKNNNGLLILSEVSLGNVLTATEVKDYSKLPDGYHSVLGVGKIRPKEYKARVLSTGATTPCGPLEENENETGHMLRYNEYVVYNIHQVKMKYLLIIKFHF